MSASAQPINEPKVRDSLAFGALRKHRSILCWRRVRKSRLSSIPAATGENFVKNAVGGRVQLQLEFAGCAARLFHQ